MGHTCQVVERWNPYSKTRLDLFGFIDIVTMFGGMCPAITGLQVTSGAHHSDHLIKIQNEPRAKLWLQAGGKIILQSWAKRGARGKRKVWTARTDLVLLDDKGCIMATPLEFEMKD